MTRSSISQLTSAFRGVLSIAAIGIACSVLLALGCSEESPTGPVLPGGSSSASACPPGQAGCPPLTSVAPSGSQGACEAPQEVCSGVCVNTQFDEANCGTCGFPCPGGQNCNFGQCTGCPNGALECNGTCTNLTMNALNCGSCGNVCPSGSCTNSVCDCASNEMRCNGVCMDVLSDPMNCGSCGNVCPGGQVCSAGACSASCTVAGEMQCGQACVNTMTSVAHCGGCNMPCRADEVCSQGQCACPAGQMDCGTGCIDVQNDSANCGMCGRMCETGRVCVDTVCTCPTGQELCFGECVAAGTCGTGNGGSGGTSDPPPGGSGPVGGSGPGNGGSGGDPVVVPTPDNRTCPVTQGLIADFEENSPAMIEIEGRIGIWEGFGDDAGTMTVAVEQEGSEECNQGVLHVSGQNFESFAGFGSVFTGTYDDVDEEYVPSLYDASQFVGISFRAKAGPGQTHPVRFSLPTPWTDGGETGDGSCVDDMNADHPCWNHLGQYLIDDEALTDQWRTYTFCFDRDLHPSWLPTGVTLAQRREVAANLLNIQFQFNQGFDPATAESHPRNASFDFYVDDVRFVTSCPSRTLFQSSSGSALAFPQNQPIGTCQLPPNIEAYNHEISSAYQRWKTNHVRVNGDQAQVWSNEDNRSISESIGYGMLISAAMGDKPLFDQLLNYWNAHPTAGSLMAWVEGGNGSATDADTDAAYALLMAEAQWGGGQYASRSAQIAADVLTYDRTPGGYLGAGSNYASGSVNNDASNPSYFSPSFYRAFAAGNGTWNDVISAGYSNLNSCTSSFGGNALPPDWCDAGSAVAANAIPADVTSLDGVVYAFDAARTPWRIGMDACAAGGSGSTYISALADFFSSRYANGNEIHLMMAGFDAQGNEHPDAEANQMSFIGPIGVAGMGANNATLRDRAFLAVLDIMERPEFYTTYYPASVGMLSLLVLSGNFPHP